ncbi:MAG: mechanosensitive ion channel [Oscillospiraceae bacterium]|nr:mechanosensitive ion channel [Oscillospiraceae bacterium]
MKKKIIQAIVIAALLAVLLIPSINPFLDDATEAAVTAQLQNTFGGLLGGTGTLTPANLICAAAVILLIWLVCSLLIWILSWVLEKNRNTRSMAGLFISLIKFVGCIVAVVWALSILGVNLTGIFASLGIASLIIGFGAQSLIEDAVTGIFIIFEGQYQVGDIIVLDGFRGTVKRIGIRTTCIEDTGGNLKIVNNSDIRNMQNRSRNASVAVCDLCISYDADIREVEKIIAATLPMIHTKYSNLYLTAPRYMGVESLGESSVVLRIAADVAEENFYAGYRTLNREMKLMCDKHNIEIPFNQLVVHQAKP